MVQFISQQKIFYLIFISLAILLTGCVSQQQIVFLENAEWLAVQTLTLSAEDQQDQNPIITGWIDLFQQMHDRPDMESVFETIQGEDGSVTYLLVVRATGYNKLEETLLGANRPITFRMVNGERQITIAEQGTVESSGGEDAMGDDVGGQIRIIGGQIIESNATRIENDNTAIWETGPFFNSSSDVFTVNVTLTEVESFSPDMIVLTRPPANVEAAMRDALNIIMPPTETTTTSELSESSELPSDSSTTAESSEVAESTEVADPTPEISTEVAEPDSTTSTEVAEAEDSATIAEPSVEIEIVTDSDDGVEAPTVTDNTLPASGAIVTPSTSSLTLLFASMLLIGLIGAGLLTFRDR